MKNNINPEATPTTPAATTQEAATTATYNNVEAPAPIITIPVANNENKTNGVINLEEESEALSPEEFERKELVESLIPYRLSVNTEYPPERNLLSVGGVPFLALGSLTAIKAKTKQGKTQSTSIQAAAALGGKCMKVEAVSENTKDAKVLVIDTEQKPSDSQRIYNQTLELAGFPKEDNYDRLQMYSLRHLDFKEKMAAVKALILEEKPDLVIIDGIVDLMLDFNNLVDSKEVIDELMSLTSKEVCDKEIAILCTLHTNKALTDSNMRGHLGTILSQKADNVFEVKKEKGIITVSNTDARHQEVPDWSFKFNNEGKLVDATEDVLRIKKAQQEAKEAKAAEKKAKKEEEMLNLFKSVIRDAGGSIAKKELLDAYMKKAGCQIKTAYAHLRKFLGTALIESDSMVSIATIAAN